MRGHPNREEQFQSPVLAARRLDRPEHEGNTGGPSEGDVGVEEVRQPFGAVNLSARLTEMLAAACSDVRPCLS